jgi:hypothetical protein
VRSILESNGIEIRPCGINGSSKLRREFDVNSAVEEYKAGRGLIYLSDKYRTSVATLRKELNKLNISTKLADRPLLGRRAHVKKKTSQPSPAEEVG